MLDEENIKRFLTTSQATVETQNKLLEHLVKGQKTIMSNILLLEARVSELEKNENNITERQANLHTAVHLFDIRMRKLEDRDGPRAS